MSDGTLNQDPATLSGADLRRHDEARADRNQKAVDERIFTYEDMRAAFAAGYDSCEGGEDPDDAWDEHRETLETGATLDEQASVVGKVLRSSALQDLIGAEEWDLTEHEEMILWDIIDRTAEKDDEE